METGVALRYSAVPMGTNRRHKKPAAEEAPPTHITEVHSRLFSADVAKIKAIATRKMIPWQTELRLIVHRALNISMAGEDQ